MLWVRFVLVRLFGICCFLFDESDLLVRFAECDLRKFGVLTFCVDIAFFSLAEMSFGGLTILRRLMPTGSCTNEGMRSKLSLLKQLWDRLARTDANR